TISKRDWSSDVCSSDLSSSWRDETMPLDVIGGDSHVRESPRERTGVSPLAPPGLWRRAERHTLALTHCWTQNARRKTNGSSDRRYGARLRGGDHRRIHSLSRMARRLMGSAVLAPEGLHAR